MSLKFSYEFIMMSYNIENCSKTGSIKPCINIEVRAGYHNLVIQLLF